MASNTPTLESAEGQEQPGSPVDEAVAIAGQDLQAQIAAMLSPGQVMSLDTLVALEKLVKEGLAKEKAAAAEQTNAVKRAKRMELITGLVDRMPMFTEEEFGSFREAGLLGIQITFPAGENGAVAYKPVESVSVARTPKEPRVGADGSTVAKSTAGSGAKPGDAQSYADATGLPLNDLLPEDQTELDTRVDKAMLEGSFDGNRAKANNSVRWNIRMKRIAKITKEAAA